MVTSARSENYENDSVSGFPEINPKSYKMKQNNSTKLLGPQTPQTPNPELSRISPDFLKESNLPENPGLFGNLTCKHYAWILNMFRTSESYHFTLYHRNILAQNL